MVLFCLPYFLGVQGEHNLMENARYFARQIDEWKWVKHVS